MKAGMWSKLAGAAAGAAGLASAATAQEAEGPRVSVAVGSTVSMIDANNMGNSDDPSCEGEGCRKPGGALLGGNNVEAGVRAEVAARLGQVEVGGSVYRGCSDFHFLATNPGQGNSCAVDGMAHARYYTHGPDARWSGFVGATAGVSRQQTEFSGTVAGRPEIPVQFGGTTWAPVYGAELGLERRIDARWAVRAGCSWRQTGDNQLPVYVNGVRDVRDPVQSGGPDGDQEWHRTTTGCRVDLVARFGG